MWWDALKMSWWRSDGVAAGGGPDGRRPMAAPPGPHPNEFDCRRIQRELSDRVRYRYVTPSVHPAESGYRIESPCCSRNIDREGGVIDIAWLNHLPDQGVWHLYHKDHKAGRWVLHTVATGLADALDLLKRDPLRLFWP